MNEFLPMEHMINILLFMQRLSGWCILVVSMEVYLVGIQTPYRTETNFWWRMHDHSRLFSTRTRKFGAVSLNESANSNNFLKFSFLI